MTNVFKKALLQRFMSEGTATKSEQMTNAKNLLDEISGYFTDVYGDLWLDVITSEEKRKSWMLNLIGVSNEEAANAVATYCAKQNSAYPPNPLLFRSYCKYKSETVTTSKLRVIR